MEISIHDWKLYRQRIGGWQEAYMEKLCREYAILLSNGSMAASKKFWALEQRIQEDKRSPSVLVKMNKSKMLHDIAQLVSDRAISFDELTDFSEELQAAVRLFLQS